MPEASDDPRLVCSHHVETRLDRIDDNQSKTILALIALVGATLGIRATETDIAYEVFYSGSFLMMAASAWLLMMAWVERKRTRLHPGLVLIILGLFGFAWPAIITSTFWLPNWGVGALRMLIAAGAGWMAWSLHHINGKLKEGGNAGS